MKLQKIAIGGHRYVSPDEVILLIGDINYTHFYLYDGSKIVVATTLKTLEARFRNHNFFRTHKSFLINLNFVKGYNDEQQISFIQMQNNKIVLVSRRLRSFEEKFQLNFSSNQNDLISRIAAVEI